MAFRPEEVEKESTAEDSSNVDPYEDIEGSYPNVIVVVNFSGRVKGRSEVLLVDIIYPVLASSLQRKCAGIEDLSCT